MSPYGESEHDKRLLERLAALEERIDELEESVYASKDHVRPVGPGLDDLGEIQDVVDEEEDD